ncbi:hypothetical protein B5F77_05345 [Parabacteroides sp. An277]|uniref:DUF3244 domain-containing protein n=1 Tax=Parabacteroides sp. An277 TaxID=1965619 RepID=UPI000B39C3B6|nr:DUF3244 domain-containing protein [Parabacteroides sp. An277]OUO53753.1 hypothetical protein B5F77_05345 [Parabacteroides sp. An277]
MMRVVKLFAVAIALLVVLPAFGEKIFWKGEWLSLPTSEELLTSICGNIDEKTKTLTFEFPCGLGDVIVSIMDASGNLIYQESVQTDVTPSVTISLDGLDVDDGTISITDGENLVFGSINL